MQQQTTTYPAVVGAVVAQLRKRIGVTQIELAVLVGLNQPAWSKIERGLTAITVEQLALIAPRLGSSPGQLLTEADRMIRSLDDQGVRVIWQRPQANSVDAAGLLGAAVIGALIAALLSRA